jgi:DNA-binding response OmpR family regulator
LIAAENDPHSTAFRHACKRILSMKCLVVEDDPRIRTLVSRALGEEGFLITEESDGSIALDRLLKESFEVAVLDIMLPGRDGLSALRLAREKGVQTPILLLTARSSLVERVEGLEYGADDYLSKPFHLAELIARVKALARRAHKEILTVLQSGDLSMNLSTREVQRAGNLIELSNREFTLLEYLLRNKGRVLSRTQICEHVWGYYFDVNDNLVDVYIKRIRKKIEWEPLPRLLHTIRGVGYRLSTEP